MNVVIVSGRSPADAGDVLHIPPLLPIEYFLDETPIIKIEKLTASWALTFPVVLSTE